LPRVVEEAGEWILRVLQRRLLVVRKPRRGWELSRTKVAAPVLVLPSLNSRHVFFPDSAL
jgi:hypothetical protein